MDDLPAFWAYMIGWWAALIFCALIVGACLLTGVLRVDLP